MRVSRATTRASICARYSAAWWGFAMYSTRNVRIWILQEDIIISHISCGGTGG